jgi:hypothetical protein
MPTICLVTPGHLGSNPRIVKEADALTEHGYQVHVVYAQTHRRDLDRDASILAKAHWQAHPVRGFAGTVGHRLRRIRQLVADAASLRWPQSLRLAISAQHPLASRLRRAAGAIRADLYIAHYVAALPAVAAAASRHRSAYAFDAEDFHRGEWPEDPVYDHRRQIIGTIEAAFLPGCSYLTAASPGIADAYRDNYGIERPALVRNVFPLSHAPEGPTPRGCASPGPSIYWFSQTIGPDRGLECAVGAIALAESKPHLHLRGFISPAFGQQLQSLARSMGVEDRLHLLPPALPSEMERLAAAYDLGLAGETGHTLNHRIALANKLFTYALAGVPAVISDIPAHADYAEQAGISVRLFEVENPTSLALAIDSYLLADRCQLSEARHATFQMGQARLNWEAEQAIFLDRVAHVFKLG